MTMICPSCKNAIDPGTRFCPLCGAAIQVSQPARPTQQQYVQPVQQPVQPQYVQPVQQPVQPQYVQPVQQPVQQYAQPQYAQPQYAAPAPAYAGAYSATKKKNSKKGLIAVLIALIAMLLVIVLLFTGFVWPAFIPKIIRSLTPMPDYVTKGYADSGRISSSTETKIGDEKDGVVLSVSPGAFSDGVKVSMEVMPKDETKDYEKEGYNIVGSVISIDADNYEGEMFAEPVTLSLDLPVSQMSLDSGECDYFIGYYNEKTKQWDLFEPENIDIKNGKAEISVMHFTHLAIIDPEENETVEKYLKDWCAEKARRETIDEEGKEAFQPYVKAIAQKMAETKDAQNALAEALMGKLISGINTDSTTGKVVSGSLDFTNTVGWGAYRALESGDTDEFRDALKTATVKALGSTLTDDGNYVNFLGSAGSIGKIAGQIDGGDYSGAIQTAEDITLNFFPTANAVDKAVKYVVRKVDMDYTMWKKDRIDDLYVKWRDGFETRSDEYQARNFDDLMRYMDFDTHSNKSGMGNADMMLKRIYDSDQKIDEQVERYGFGHRSYNSLSDDEKEQFQKRVTHGLKEYFEQRYKTEKKAKAMEKDEIEFINYLYKWDYLKAGNFTEYFRDSGKGEFSVSRRLDRLHSIRDKISNWVDTKKMDETFTDYGYLVSQWVRMNIDYPTKEAQIEYLKFLKENDLLKKSVNIPGLDEVTIDDIVGTWDVNATFTDIDSPMLDWFSQLMKDILGGIAEELGEDADSLDLDLIDDSYKDGASVRQTVTIEKISKDKVEVVISSSEGDSATYQGTLKDGLLKLHVTKSSTGNDDAIALDIQDLEYKFYKTNGYVKMDGSYYIRSWAFNATYIYNGNKTS